jgi:hypothetical protein
LKDTPDKKLIIVAVVAIVSLTALFLLFSSVLTKQSQENVAGQALVSSTGATCKCTNGVVTCTTPGGVSRSFSCETGTCNEAGNGCQVCIEGKKTRCLDGKLETKYVNKDCSEVASEYSFEPCQTGQTCYPGENNCRKCDPDPSNKCTFDTGAGKWLIQKSSTNEINCAVTWQTLMQCAEACNEQATGCKCAEKSIQLCKDNALDTITTKADCTKDTKTKNCNEGTCNPEESKCTCYPTPLDECEYDSNTLTWKVREAKVNQDCIVSWSDKYSCVRDVQCTKGKCVCPVTPPDRCNGDILEMAQVNQQTCEKTWIKKQTCIAGHCEAGEGMIDAECTECTPGDIPNSETCDDTSVPGIAIVSIKTITDAQCNEGTKTKQVCGGMPFIKGVCADSKSCTTEVMQENDLPSTDEQAAQVSALFEI